MNNLILALINALCMVGVFTKEEAKVLCHELHYATLSDNFEGSYMQIEKIFQKLEIDRKFYLEDKTDHDLLKELEGEKGHFKEMPVWKGKMPADTAAKPKK